MSTPPVPAGFARRVLPHATLVAREELVDGLHHVLATGCTLHEWAARRPDARAYAGRGIAWGVSLPNEVGRAVVRHNRHGGMFARLTGDLFLTPTLAPMELDLSLRLAAGGVPTPAMLAYAVYPVSPLAVLARSDVMTREIAESEDLGALLARTRPGSERRASAFAATRTLLSTLERLGARHHDLNVKNVLIAATARGSTAYVLDVDRVEFTPRGGVADRKNRDRLRRSLRKWQRHGKAELTESDIANATGADGGTG